jgi:hypothetical protein
MVGLLGQVISPSQGLYLHRTTQHRRTRDKHPCLERDSNDRSRPAPQTARPLDWRSVTITQPIHPSQPGTEDCGIIRHSRYRDGVRQQVVTSCGCDQHTAISLMARRAYLKHHCDPGRPAFNARPIWALKAV